MSETYEEMIRDYLRSPKASNLPLDYLRRCLSEGQDLQRVASLKQFGAALRKQSPDSIPQAERDLCCDILTWLCVKIEPKGALHRAVTSILQSFPCDDDSYLTQKLGSSLSIHLSQCSRTSKEECRRCVDVISGLMENFPRGEKSVATEYVQVINFLHDVLQAFMESARCTKDTISQNEAMHNCLATVKTIVAVVQRCSQHRRFINNTENAQRKLEQMLQTMWNILSEACYLADCRSAAGLAIVLLVRSLNTCDDHSLCHVVYTAFFHHLTPATTNSETPPLSCGLASERFDTANLSPQSYLFICHGVLAMLAPKDLTEQGLPLDKQCLLHHILFPEILGLTERLTDPSSTLTASRTLTLWTSVAVAAMTASGCHDNSSISLLGSAEIPQKLIQYVWTNWDHPIEGIRYQTKIIFENVLQLHAIAKEKSVSRSEDDPFLLGLFNSLASVNWHVRGKYMPLISLVKHLGAKRILALYPTMPQELLGVFEDQTLAPYACDLLESLFTDHRISLKIGDPDTEVSSCWQRTWIVPFLEFLCNPATSEKQKTYLTEYLIPRILKCSSESLEFIIKHLDQSNGGSSPVNKPGLLGALVTCLKSARSMGLLKHDGKQGDSNHGQSETSMWKGLVPYHTLKEALCHKDNQIRIDALGLMCDSNKTTEAISAEELSLLVFFLTLNMNSSSPSFRQTTTAYLKKLFVRLRESGRVYLKQVTNYHRLQALSDQQCNPHEKQIEIYKDFLSQLTQLLFEALQPGSSYPRRTTALQTLQTMLDIFKNKGKTSSFFNLDDVWTPDHIQLLLHRLTDPYESNKVMTFELLSSLTQETLGLMDQSRLDTFYENALHLASSSKPHNCETASFILRLLARQLTRPIKRCAVSLAQNIKEILDDLCAKLIEEVGVAKSSLLEAAVQGPMYGILHCIRELLADVNLGNASESEGWSLVVSQLIMLCLEVADAASVVVCNSSPEGYIPHETDSALENSDVLSEEDTLASTQSSRKAMKVTPQMVLVCCWRSMKEVSLLMGHLALSAPLMIPEPITSGLISQIQLEEIGKFFLRLLKESKHRGAFELAYSGFIMLTTRLWKSKSPSLHQLPKQWLQGLLTDITTSQSALCATRRSAGIPFAIQAIIGSEPSQPGKSCFKEAMGTLLSLALPESPSDEDVTSQVHALNILRVLYKDTRLGEDVMPFIADGVKAAVLGFAAQLWNVRNSSTLLFSALVTRIFGVQRAKQDYDRRNCMTGKEFFARFPTLYPFLLVQLKEATGSTAASGMAHMHPSLFPVLLLLSRLYPSPMDGAHTRLSMDQFVPFVIKCAHSAVYKTRAIAARALVPLVSVSHQVDTIKALIELLPSMPEARSQHNQIHGVLLQIHALLEYIMQMTRTEDNRASLAILVPALAGCFWLASSLNKCCVTRAAFLAILKTLCFETSVEDSDTHYSHLKGQVASVAIKELRAWSQHVDIGQQCPGFVILQETCASIGLRFLSHPSNVQCSSCTSHNPCIDERMEHKGITPTDSEQSLSAHRLHTSTLSQQQSNMCMCCRERSVDSILHVLLSSCVYEVRLLVLDHLIKNIQSSDHLQKTLATSHQIFQKLVAMVTEEEHMDCLAKVYEVLSYHPMTCQFPWQLPGHRVTCLECFQAAVGVAALPKQREDLVCSVLRFTSSIIPVLCRDPTSLEPLTAEPVCKLVSGWSLLMDQCSQADQTTQSRLTVVNIIGLLADIILSGSSPVLGNAPFVLWGIVIRLLQDSEPTIQKEAVSCIRRVGHVAGYNDTQPSLGLHLGIQLFIALFIEQYPKSCLHSLVEWAIGPLETGSSCNQDEQEEDERLFDQGEANTSFEGVPLAKIISKQLCILAKIVHRTASCGVAQKKLCSVLKTKEESSLAEQLKTLTVNKGARGVTCWVDPSVETYSPLTSRSKRGSDLEISQTGTSRHNVLDRSCISPVLPCHDQFSLSLNSIHYLQSCVADCLTSLASRLQDSLDVWLAASPFLNAGEWEMQYTDVSRILLCCSALTELLPCSNEVDSSLKTTWTVLLRNIKTRFCDGIIGSCSPLVQEPLDRVCIWCGLTEKFSR